MPFSWSVFTDSLASSGRFFSLEPHDDEHALSPAELPDLPLPKNEIPMKITDIMENHVFALLSTTFTRPARGGMIGCSSA